MEHNKLDIVLPCYNPLPGWAQNIISSVTNIQTQLPQTEIYVYVVNDGSLRGVNEEDLTLLKQELPHFQYIHYPENRGKGYALREGVKQAQHSICIYTDIDFPYTEESLIRVYQTLQYEQQDIAVGVRDEAYYASVPPMRVKISKTLRFFARKMLLLPVNDTQAGLKGFNSKGREAFLQTQIDRYLFDLEFLFTAAKDPKLHIKPVKVTLKPGIVFSRMNSKILVTEGYSFMKLFLSRPFSKLQKRS